jgi:hypothetical protein
MEHNLNGGGTTNSTPHSNGHGANGYPGGLRRTQRLLSNMVDLAPREENPPLGYPLMDSDPNGGLWLKATSEGSEESSPCSSVHSGQADEDKKEDPDDDVFKTQLANYQSDSSCTSSLSRSSSRENSGSSDSKDGSPSQSKKRCFATMWDKQRQFFHRRRRYINLNFFMERLRGNIAKKPAFVFNA